MKTFAIVLSGCGVYDGAEIHEATMAMLAVRKKGHQYQIFAPNMWQYHVVNHLTGEEMPEKRNVLVESARIARGNIKDLKDFDAAQFDALIFAGGFGVAKNLCDFAVKGENYQVSDSVAKVIKDMYAAGKPIGAMCVSPILLAGVLDGVKITLGDPCDSSRAAEKHGAKHQVATLEEVVVDQQNKLATTPCYMLDADIAQISEGADHLVDELLKLM